MHKFLTLALLALTACAPELEGDADSELNSRLVTGGGTLTVSNCTKDSTCNGKTPQQLSHEGTGNGITCAAHMEDCPQAPLRPLGNVYISDLGSTFAITPNAEEAHEFSNGNSAVTVATFSGLPAGVSVVGVYSGDFIRPLYYSRGTVVIDELLVELSNGQYLMTNGSAISGNYSMSAASGPTTPTVPGFPGGGICTLGPC